MSAAHKEPVRRQERTSETPQCHTLARGQSVSFELSEPISERPREYAYLARIELPNLRWGRDEAWDDSDGETAVYRLLWLGVPRVRRDDRGGYTLSSDSLLHPDDPQRGCAPREIVMDNPLVLVGEELFGWDAHGRRIVERGIAGIPQDGIRYGFGPRYNAHQLDYPEGAQQSLFSISIDPATNIVRLVNASSDILQVHCHAVPDPDPAE